MTELKYIETKTFMLTHDMFHSMIEAGIFNEKDEEGVEYPGPYAFPGTIGCFFGGSMIRGMENWNE